MLDHVDLYGQFPTISVNGTRDTWRYGTLGNPGQTNGPYTCTAGAGEPSWVGNLLPSDGSHATFDHITFRPTSLIVQGGCTPHIENIRLESGANGFTLSNSTFIAGGDEGSGHIFSSVQTNDVTLESNVFQPLNGTYAMQVYMGNNWQIRRNDFQQPVIADGGTPIACGNTGSADATWRVAC